MEVDIFLGTSRKFGSDRFLKNQALALALLARS